MLEDKNDNTSSMESLKEQKQTLLQQKNQNQKNDSVLLFTCKKEDYYYIKLYEGEKLYLEK